MLTYNPIVGLWVVIFILSTGTPIVTGRFKVCSDSPSPPNCADDCSGSAYYLSQNGDSCLKCPSCDPGYELAKLCESGFDGDSSCVPCKDETFADGTTRSCMRCRTCTNTVELVPCTSSTNRECGDCIPGYFRSRDRFTNMDSCPNRCSDNPRDTLACADWWDTQAPGATNGQPQEHDEAPAVVQAEVQDESCDPTPPRCEDDCHGNRYYLGRDKLCKMCLQCLPGYELNKVCGNGKNGNAVCRRCEPGFFSLDGRGRCTPCRICVNSEELTSCRRDSDVTCGDCLPGFYKGTDGFFDPTACPNSCAENPRDTPQCREWWQSRATAAAPGQTPTDLPPNEDMTTAEGGRHTGIFKKEIAPPKGGVLHEVVGVQPTKDNVTYLMVITALGSSLLMVIVLLAVALVIYKRRKHPISTISSTSGEAPLITPGTPGGSSIGSSSRIYKPVTSTPSPMNRQRSAIETMTLGFHPHSESRPDSMMSSDSSACSTPLIQRVMAKSPMSPANGQAECMNESPSVHYPTSSVPVITESTKGNAVRFKETDRNTDVPNFQFTTLRRRSSIVTTSDPNTQQSPREERRRSSTNMQVGAEYANGKEKLINDEGQSRNGKYPHSSANATVGPTLKEPEATISPIDSSDQIKGSLRSHENVVGNGGTCGGEPQKAIANRATGVGSERAELPSTGVGSSTAKAAEDGGPTFPSDRKAPTPVCSIQHRQTEPSTASITILMNQKIGKIQIGNEINTYHDAIPPDESFKEGNEEEEEEKEEEEGEEESGMENDSLLKDTS